MMKTLTRRTPVHWSDISTGHGFNSNLSKCFFLLLFFLLWKPPQQPPKGRLTDFFLWFKNNVFFLFCGHEILNVIDITIMMMIIMMINNPAQPIYAHLTWHFNLRLVRVGVSFKAFWLEEKFNFSARKYSCWTALDPFLISFDVER